MHNIDKPNDADLPSTRKLLRSTLLALVVASVVLVAVVLPAEYAIDPTGIGRALGLTEMGEIKAQLAKEAAADAAADATGLDAATRTVNAPVAPPADGVARSGTSAPSVVAPAAPGEDWRDEMRVVLQPGEGAEIKLVMKAGEQAEFSWAVQDGTVNFDAHADGGGQSISYEKGRSARSDAGVLKAAFDGNHGWFWRNRGDAPVTVVLRVRGQYSDIKRLV
ncbi:transmembrane anchor protein [Lysobacter korlensis]|uniref:Transmembrane anchor protein n=1 Tax=Lysobacter korlensis TaxID=553636 RepID=A0ABV6RRD3_9GAMM